MSFSVESFKFETLPENFEFNQVPEWFPSICIPRAFSNIDRRTIYNVFVNLFGHDAIERIDMVSKENERGEKFNRIFVHFNSWPRTQQSSIVRKRLLEGKTIDIVYDEPWFWKCSASRVAKPQPVARGDVRPYVVVGRDDKKAVVPKENQRDSKRIDLKVAHTSKDERQVTPTASTEQEKKPKNKFQFVPQSVTTTRKSIQKKE